MAESSSKPLRIVVDTFESKVIDGVLAARGVLVQRRRLPVGDYRLPDGTLIERKTVRDLHASLIAGRLWRQVAAVRRRSPYGFLIVEGGNIDDGPIEANAIRGVCLAVIGQGVPLIRTTDLQDSGRWIHVLAERRSGPQRSRDRPIYGQRPTSRRPDVREAMLAATPGISVVTARALLTRSDPSPGSQRRRRASSETYGESVPRELTDSTKASTSRSRLPGMA